MYYIAVSFNFIMVMFSAARCTPGATSKAWTLSLGRKEWLHWRLNALWCGTLSWVRPPQNKARMYSRVKSGSGYCQYLSLWLAYVQNPRKLRLIEQLIGIQLWLGGLKRTVNDRTKQSYRCGVHQYMCTLLPVRSGVSSAVVLDAGLFYWSSLAVCTFIIK